MSEKDDYFRENDNLALYSIDLLPKLIEYALERRGLDETIDSHYPIGFRVRWQVIEAREGQDHEVLSGLGETATLPALAIVFTEDEWGDELAGVSAFDEALDLSDEQLRGLTLIASSHPTDVTKLG